MTQPPTRVVVRRPGAASLTGNALPGEALYSAAVRILCAGELVEGPDALDLSGAEKLFTLTADPLVGFRPMSRADFPDVVRWQRVPHVARWWDDQDLDAVAAHYGPSVDGNDPNRPWVVELNGRSVGFVQDYRIGDNSDYAISTAQPEAIGFDYAIADPSWVGRGVGTMVLWRFLRDVMRPHYPEARTFFAAPDHRNAASLRVLDKLGFTRGLWFDEPQPGGRVDTAVSCTLDVRRILG